MSDWVWIAILSVLLAGAAVPLPGLVGALGVSARAELALPPSSTREYASITRQLRRPFDGYGTLDVPVPGFAVVALSHMASGFLNVYLAEPDKRSDAHAYVREVERRALSSAVSPSHAAVGPDATLDDHNLYWSHLGLILGIERYMRCAGVACPTDGAAARLDRLHERIAAHLRARSLATGLFHAPSYPGSPMWPADQAVALLAMKLFDVTHGTTLHEEPLRGFLRTVRRLADTQTGLFPSSVSHIANATVPRGCAAMFASAYLAQLDPAAAYDQYVRARESFRVDVLGLGGFREWPIDRSGPADVDSGPIVLGVGVAATGLGLAPARIFGDDVAYTVIRRTVLFFGLPAFWSSRGYLAAPLLGEAILFDGRTARSWFAKAPTIAPSQAPPPVAPLVGAALDVALLAAIALKLARRLRRAGAQVRARAMAYSGGATNRW